MKKKKNNSPPSYLPSSFSPGLRPGAGLGRSWHSPYAGRVSRRGEERGGKKEKGQVLYLALYSLSLASAAVPEDRPGRTSRRLSERVEKKKKENQGITSF